MLDTKQSGVREFRETILVRRSASSPREWDAFARRCGASFRCGYHAGRAWQFEHHRFFRLRRVDVLAIGPQGMERKVGQCAVGVGRSVAAFADELQMLPDAADRWPDAMSAALAHLGGGSFVYGSEWSLSPPREADLAQIEGVRIDAVAATSVQVIDLARWPTFDAFRMACSANVRRNVKKAEKSHASLALDVRPGLRGVSHFLKSLSLRRNLFRRKGVARSTLGMAARSAARMASLRRYTETVQLSGNGAAIASYVGVNFGNAYCYLEGAADDGGRGASWYLLMAMIERAFADSGGRGRFVMGSDDGTQDGVEAWEGLKRSRRQCCAEPVPTSVVRFTYRPPAA